ncbi:VOC family protein [Occultella aeris]|uniref:Glyoxalase-like domain protein n=1 Tax=Occultella aeris TaxID=2761496 RepID=A0A7M4DNP3_9MICO|nr:VOC family protein [Occultella aeris]VZO39074.1 Glyoxalase-like domain protein [Occultella aeris]
MTGRVVHFEVPFDDGDRARSFYRDIFGWQIDSMPGFDYSFVSTGPSAPEQGPTEPGYIGGGMMQRQAPIDKPVITIDTADIDATLAKVTAAGGAVVVGKNEIGEGMGFTAYVTDSEGNLIGLYQSARPAG